MSELLANAALHASGAQELILHATPAVLRIEVLDASPLIPRPRSPHHPGLPGGHGLHIVERLSDRWGVAIRGGGKTVWAEVDSSSTPPPTQDR